VKKVRVLHCLETIGSGGVEQRRLSLIKGLDATQYEQRVVCTQAIRGLPSEFERAGCRITQVGVFRSITDRAPYRAALEVVRSYQPDIIHGAVYEGVALAAVAGRLGKVPIIIGEETSDPRNRSWKGDLLYWALASLCHHMVGVSSSATGYLLQTIKLPRRKVTLIENGVSQKLRASETTVKALRKKFDLPIGGLVIGTVSRLIDDPKRVSDLIRAMSMVVSEHPEAWLLVVGAGPDEGALKALANDLGLSDHVRFVGYQADPQPFYQVMDVFALASAHEGFGLVLVEAMFAELPVIATRVGGIPNIVQESETGYLVEPFQPVNLANFILRLADDPTLRHSMGLKGRARALAQFSAERYVGDVDALYQRLLAERRVI